MNIDRKLISAFVAIQQEIDVKYIDEIIQLIRDNQLYRDKIDEILEKYNVGSYKDAKDDFLDLIIYYINYSLLDDKIDQTEYYNTTQLKRLFKIETGDFYKYRFDEIEEIIMKQVYRIYEDNQIEELEAIHKSMLQGIFDLSYDQINEFVTEEVERALMQGGDIKKLDAYYKSPNIPVKPDDAIDKIIPSAVKTLVFKRDKGECVKCGSNANLEFIPIIPFSKGGSNTARNIEMLCDKCKSQ